MFNLLRKHDFVYDQTNRQWQLVIFNPYLQPLLTLLVRGCGRSAPCLIYRKVGPRIVQF